jgi:hypothetical protein
VTAACCGGTFSLAASELVTPAGWGLFKGPILGEALIERILGWTGCNAEKKLLGNNQPPAQDEARSRKEATRCIARISSPQRSWLR